MGRVYLVGAGPGDPGLLTCRGLECLQRADVVIYDGLAPVELLLHTPDDCEHIYAGKKRSAHGGALDQEQINALLIERARAGRMVVRLKGGDPFIFGRGAEECLALANAGLQFEVVPGVSAASAVPAYAGIPLTARGVSASVVLVTGHEAADKSAGGVNWQAVAGNQSIVLFMAWKQIQECVTELLKAGLAPNTSAAAIRWGTRADQRTVKTTLEQLPETMTDQAMRPPLLVVIGAVVDMSDALSWFETRPLFGKRVLLTRDANRVSEVCLALRDLGAEPLACATTRIEFPSEHEQVALAKRLASDEWDWLLLSSVNAVMACQLALHGQGLDSRALASGKIAVIGKATKAALAGMGITADLASAGDGMSLAKSLAARCSATTHILFPRAEHGREEPVQFLQDAGHHVDLVTAYQSMARSASEPVLADALYKLRAGELHAVAFFAPSQVHALCDMGDDIVQTLAKVPVLAAIGPTTATALASRGLRANAIASAPTSQAMACAIADAFLVTEAG